MKNLITTNTSGYQKTTVVRDDAHAERVIDRMQAAGKTVVKARIEKI